MQTYQMDYRQGPTYFSALLGMRVSRAYRVLATQYLEFGELHETGEWVGLGEYRLIIQCPWRIEKEDELITGSEDLRIDLAAQSGPGDLLEKRLNEVFHVEDEGPIPTDVVIRLVSVEIDRMLGMRLGLSSGYEVTLFPAGTDAEFWRLASSEGHLVAKPARLTWVGDGQGQTSISRIP
jgi:hypothetical protein